jgi:FkbM family methyltransferase
MAANDRIYAEFLNGYLPSLADPVIVEVGCAQAEDTPHIINLLRGDWKYYAFEPDPRSVAIFKTKVNDPRVILTEAAVGDRTGSVDFYLSGPTHFWSSSLRKPKTHLQVSPQITFEVIPDVLVLTLDQCFANIVSRIDLLWADIQGCELDMLKGAANTLPKTRYLYLEYSDEELYEGQGLYQDLLDYLKDFEVVRKFDEEVPDKHCGDVLLRNKRL